MRRMITLTITVCLAMAGSGMAQEHADTAYVPDIPLRQIFIKDPNGVIVELNFRDV